MNEFNVKRVGELTKRLNLNVPMNECIRKQIDMWMTDHEYHIEQIIENKDVDNPETLTSRAGAHITLRSNDDCNDRAGTLTLEQTVYWQRDAEKGELLKWWRANREDYRDDIEGYRKRVLEIGARQGRESGLSRKEIEIYCRAAGGNCLLCRANYCPDPL